MRAVSGGTENLTKTELAARLGVSLASLYYRRLLPEKDNQLRVKIEAVMQSCPDYGYRPIAITLGINHKRIRRVMKKFGLKPARRAKAPRKPQDAGQLAKAYPCITKLWCPLAPNMVWVSDFTYIPFHGRFVYLATVLDLFTGEVLGAAVMTNHDAELVKRSILYAAKRAGRYPDWFHSDQGSEYSAEEIISLLDQNQVSISMSPKSSPWRNGMQESFYGRFKIALGDPERYDTVEQLAEAIYQTIHYFSNIRIKVRLKCSPIEFRKKWENAQSTSTNTSPQLISLPPRTPPSFG